MVKKKDWKYTISYNFLKDIRPVYNKALKRLYEIFMNQIENIDRKIYLTEIGYYRKNKVVTKEIILNNSYGDIMSFLEKINVRRKERNFYENHPLEYTEIINGMNEIMHMVENEKEFNRMISLNDKKPIEYFKTLDEVEALNKFFGMSKIKLDFYNDKGEIDLYKLESSFINFKNYSLKDFLNNDIFNMITKSKYTQSKIHLYKLTYGIMTILENLSFRLDNDEKLVSILNELNNIYDSYNYLMQELKNNSVKKFTEIIEEKLPNLDLIEYKNDDVQKTVVEKKIEKIDSKRRLKKIDGMILKLNQLND